MNSRRNIILVLSLLSFVLFCFSLSVNINAQEFNFNIDVRDEYYYEIKSLNVNKFKATFGSEPDVQVGDQCRYVVIDVENLNDVTWNVLIEHWDFGTNWGEGGEYSTLEIYADPKYYDDELLVPTPTESFLEEALTHLPTSYYAIGGNGIGLQAVSSYTVGDQTVTVDYKKEKTFDFLGVMTSETYLDDQNHVIIRLEKILQIIPFGFSFIGFMAISVLGMVVLIVKLRRVKIFV